MREATAPAARCHGRRMAPRATRAAVARAAVAAGLAGLAVMGAAGCVARAGAAGAGRAIELSTAYVPVPAVPGTTVAYVVIRNNGPADRLIAARTSVGGRVTFRVARGPTTSATRAVAAVRIPAHATFAMDPEGVHMLITGAGPLPGGKAIRLTLVFARAGPVSVTATVVNPASTNNDGYFLG